MKSFKPILRRAFIFTIIILVLVALPASSALAQSDGPRNAGAGTNQDAVGTESWANPGNITTAGSPYASVILRRMVISNYLEGTLYGFDIPTDAAIQGIEVIVTRNANPPTTSVTDYEVRVLKAGVPVGENKASATAWPNVLTAVTYGGPTDLWGTTWTPAEVNASNFGAAVSAQRDNNGNNDRTAVVDTIQITVYYGYSSTTEVVCGTPATYGDNVSCTASVTSGNGATPTGTVAWTTDGSGSFAPNPCSLEGTGNVATCSATYTPSAVGDGSHLVTAAYSGDTILNPSDDTQSVTVNPKVASVTPDAASKAYGEADPAFTGTLVGFLPADGVTALYSRTPGETVAGSPYTISAVLSPVEVLSNYAVTYNTADFTIVRRPVEVTADSQSKDVGQPDPVLTYQVTAGSLLSGDAFSGELTREPGEGVRTYAILQGALSLPDYYELTYVGATFTINGFRLLLPIIMRR